MHTFAKTVERWMAGRTAESCAHLLSVTPNTLRNWLDGSLPPGTRIPAIAAGLGVDEARLRQTVNRERAARKHAADGATATNDATATIPPVEAQP